MTERKERRLTLLLDGAITAFEEASPAMMTALDKHDSLLNAFDRIGSALHWMRQELKEPEQLPHHSGNARTEPR